MCVWREKLQFHICKTVKFPLLELSVFATFNFSRYRLEREFSHVRMNRQISCQQVQRSGQTRCAQVSIPQGSWVRLLQLALFDLKCAAAFISLPPCDYFRGRNNQGWWYAADFLTLCILCSGKKYSAYYADYYARILHEIFC